MKALVTGAAGFIGSHLCARLLEDGHDVAGLDNLSEGSANNLAAAVNLHEADLRDASAVARAAMGCEVIYHQGAMRSVPRSMVMPAATTEVNVMGTLNVLLAARDVGARVVFASSSSVYGEQDEYPFRETMEPRPQSPYAASKLAGEVYCTAWTRSYGVPAVSLRYFNVYGPGQDPHSEYATVVPRFVLACLRGEPPSIDGDGTQARDFTYIDDAVEANVLAAAAGEDAWGAVLNVGGGREPTSVNGLLETIAELTGTSPQPTFGPPRPGDVPLTDADVTLARELIGYRPQTDVRAGLGQAIEWFREHATHI